LPEGRAPPAPTQPGRRAVDPLAATKALGSTLSKRDGKLGLDVPGASVAATALTEAVRGSDLPPEARATFEVKLDASGRVESIKVLGTTAGDAQKWAAVVASAKVEALGARARDGAARRGGDRGREGRELDALPRWAAARRAWCSPSAPTRSSSRSRPC
jgi:hypothetical protein